MIYLDNAATTLHKPDQVIDAVVLAMRQFGNVARGTHEESLSAARVVFNTRKKLAELFNCTGGANNTVFCLNSTEALNIAINGIINEGEHVISTDLEHNSVLRPLYKLEKEKNVVPDFVRADKNGNIDYSDFERLITKRTKAIVCTHASNLTGLVLDIKLIGEIAKKHGLLFIVDASQTAGVFDIDMKAMNIDVLCFTGHKSLFGPQGVGGLCIAEGVEISVFKTGGTGVKTFSLEQPKEYPVRLEAGTLNSHGIAGLSAALDFLEEAGIKNIREKEEALAKRFYEGVKSLDNITIYGDYTRLRAPIVSLNIGEYDSGIIADELAVKYDIATRPGGHCAPRIHRALGTVKQGIVRFSFSYFNTEEEVDKAIEAVAEISR